MAQCQRLQQQIAAMQSVYLQSEQERLRLEERCKVSDEESCAAKKRHTQAEEDAARFSRETELLRRELERASRAMGDVNGAWPASSSRDDTTRLELDTVKVNNNHLIMQNSELLNELSRVRAEAEALRGEASALRALQSRYKEDVDRYREDKLRAEETAVTLRHEKASLELRLATAGQTLAHRDSASSCVEDMMNSMHKLRVELKHIVTENACMRMELDTWRPRGGELPKLGGMLPPDVPMQFMRGVEQHMFRQSEDNGNVAHVHMLRQSAEEYTNGVPTAVRQYVMHQKLSGWPSSVHANSEEMARNRANHHHYAQEYAPHNRNDVFYNSDNAGLKKLSLGATQDSVSTNEPAASEVMYPASMMISRLPCAMSSISRSDSMDGARHRDVEDVCAQNTAEKGVAKAGNNAKMSHLHDNKAQDADAPKNKPRGLFGLFWWR